MNNLRKIRLEDNRKLTQKDIADFLGIERTTYGKYETGSSEPNFETICKLADFFNVSIEYLMNYTNAKKKLTPEEVSELPEAKKLESVMKEMSPEQRQHMVEYARFLVDMEKKNRTEK